MFTEKVIYKTDSSTLLVFFGIVSFEMVYRCSVQYCCNNSASNEISLAREIPTAQEKSRKNPKCIVCGNPMKNHKNDAESPRK